MVNYEDEEYTEEYPVDEEEEMMADLFRKYDYNLKARRKARWQNY